MEMKTRSPEKFTDVSEVMILTRMVFLSNSMMINRRAGENLDQSRGRLRVFQPFIQTGQRDLVSARHWLSLHDERVIASNSTSNMSLMECGHSENLLSGGDHSCE